MVIILSSVALLSAGGVQVLSAGERVLPGSAPAGGCTGGQPSDGNGCPKGCRGPALLVDHAAPGLLGFFHCIVCCIDVPSPLQCLPCLLVPVACFKDQQECDAIRWTRGLLFDYRRVRVRMGRRAQQPRYSHGLLTVSYLIPPLYWPPVLSCSVTSDHSLTRHGRLDRLN